MDISETTPVGEILGLKKMDFEMQHKHTKTP